MSYQKHSSDFSVKEIAELLEVTSKKIPELINGIIQSFYSQEAATHIGKAVGSLYKELVESGIPQDVAMNMAKDYMFSLKDMMKSMSFQNKKDE